jgi:hypothetical protein
MALMLSKLCVGSEECKHEPSLSSSCHRLCCGVNDEDWLEPLLSLRGDLTPPFVLSNTRNLESKIK